MDADEERTRVLDALRIAQDKIARTNRDGYAKCLRYRRGEIVQTYTLTQAHMRVAAAMYAYSMDRIDAQTAMAVLHEAEVRREMDGTPGLVVPATAMPYDPHSDAIRFTCQQNGWVQA